MEDYRLAKVNASKELLDDIGIEIDIILKEPVVHVYDIDKYYGAFGNMSKIIEYPYMKSSLGYIIPTKWLTFI